MAEVEGADSRSCLVFGLEDGVVVCEEGGIGKGESVCWSREWIIEKRVWCDRWYRIGCSEE